MKEQGGAEISQGISRIIIQADYSFDTYINMLMALYEIVHHANIVTKSPPKQKVTLKSRIHDLSLL